MYTKGKFVRSAAFRRVTALMMAFVLGIAGAPAVYADEDPEEIEEGLEELEEEKQYLEDQASQVYSEQNYTAAQIEQINLEMMEVEAQMAELDNQIHVCEVNIQDLEAAIAENELLMEQTAAELATAKEIESGHYEELKARLQIMYEYGDVNYLELLLGSKSISDFFSRIEYINEMAAYDEKIQNDLKNDRETIQELESRQTQTQLELDMNHQKLEKERESLAEAMQSKQDFYAQLQSDQESYQNYLFYLYEQSSWISAQIAEKEQLISTEEARLEAAREAKRLAEEKAREEEEARLAAEESQRAEAERQAEESRQAEEERQAEESRRAEEEAAQQEEEEEEDYTDSGSTSSSDSGVFTWPVPSSYYISSPYGYRIHPIDGTYTLHAGTDIAANYGSNIVAADSGTVIVAQYHWSYGNFIMISHPTGYVTLYAHCSQLLVYVGQQVSRGEVIALVGETGEATGPHCHFEVRVNGSTMDAMLFF